MEKYAILLGTLGLILLAYLALRETSVRPEQRRSRMIDECRSPECAFDLGSEWRLAAYTTIGVPTIFSIGTEPILMHLGAMSQNKGARVASGGIQGQVESGDVLVNITQIPDRPVKTFVSFRRSSGNELAFESEMTSDGKTLIVMLPNDRQLVFEKLF